MIRTLIVATISAVFFWICPVNAGDCHNSHKHLNGIHERGDREMGFDHTKTRHHFRLSREGGTIEVDANDPKDGATLHQVRSHLKQIVESFDEGNFDKPMAIHDQLPPGVSTMIRLKEAIHYRFEEKQAGGVVRISSENSEAVSAIHEFLRFQIQDHQTGDSVQVE